MINYQDIRKRADGRHKYLAVLGDTELTDSDESSYVCADKHGGMQILFWDITHSTDGKTSDQDYFFQRHPAREKGNAIVKLKNLSPGSYRLATCQIGFGQNDSHSRYLELGQSSDLNRTAIGELKSLSSGKPVSETTVTVDANGEFETTLPLHEDDVCFLSLTPE